MKLRHHIFSKEKLFAGQKYRRMEDKKPKSGLTLNQDFAKGRGLKAKVNKWKLLNWEAY